MGCCDSKHQDDEAWLKNKTKNKREMTIAGGGGETLLVIKKRGSKA